MENLLSQLTKIVFISVFAIVLVGHVKVIHAEELTNLRDEMAYGYDAMLERLEEKERNMQFLHYEQQ